MNRIIIGKFLSVISYSLCLLLSISLYAQTNNTSMKKAPNMVVHGTPTTAAHRPYQVMLLMNGQQGCGGTLIDANWVLTAAHCVEQANTYNLTVRVGATRVTGWEGNTIQVNQIIIHPNWMGQQNIRNGWDIALLQLVYPADARYTPAKLPTREVMENAATVGKYGTVSGWGATYYGGRGTDQLLAAELKVIDNQSCSQQLRFQIPFSAICAGNAYGASACNGDSGGPFVVNYGGDFYSIGIVSWGERCMSSSVFTKTYSYNNWIIAQTGISH
ncbi:serine protease [Zooshikella sp. RANM57]|uniref:serine protease n=1 Tax=Zooshikella sp. RANM57 TaxID=3425863 RepID=UPI003D6EC14C